jgi:hypothetical protein
LEQLRNFINSGVQSVGRRSPGFAFGVLMIALLVFVIGCSNDETHTDETGRRVAPQKADQPAFHIDPAIAFSIEFGRGSGWHGLDTVRVEQDGRVTLSRLIGSQTNPSWETATIQLQQNRLADILKAVETNGLMSLRRTYQDPNIADGTQWVLWITQGDHEKSVYFNNRFPVQITGFAEQLDRILSVAGLGNITWQPVPASQSRSHERELWKSIER